jgi:hypothetical protein
MLWKVCTYVHCIQRLRTHTYVCVALAVMCSTRLTTLVWTCVPWLCERLDLFVCKLFFRTFYARCFSLQISVCHGSICRYHSPVQYNIPCTCHNLAFSYLRKLAYEPRLQLFCLYTTDSYLPLVVLLVVCVKLTSFWIFESLTWGTVYTYIRTYLHTCIGTYLLFAYLSIYSSTTCGIYIHTYIHWSYCQGLDGHPFVSPC